MMKMIFAGIAVLIVFVVAFAMFRQKPTTSTQNLGYNQESEVLPTGQNSEPREETNTMNLEKPELSIDSNKTYKALLSTTEGDITIELNAKDTPITSNNFVYLTKQGFYDNTIFHRVIDGFMIQGGDPTGTGTGSPGYRFDDEPFTGEYTRGTVAMANSGKNTNGSQFFIMHGDLDLPKDYVIFGRVVEGLDVVDKIATAETTISLGGEKSKPVNPVKIVSATIIEE